MLHPWKNLGVRSMRRTTSNSSFSVGKDKSRTIPFRPPDKLQARFPANVVRNRKYNVATFLPLVFYELQFKFFFDLYFLLVALSQFIPALKICNICRASHFCAHSNHEKRSVRRLQTQPSRPRSQFAKVSHPRTIFTFFRRTQHAGCAQFQVARRRPCFFEESARAGRPRPLADIRPERDVFYSDRPIQRRD